MGELAKRRRARDLWISRGHLWAGGVVVLLSIGIAFFVGYSLGSRRVEVEATGEATLTGAAEDDLVELLSRIDASADPTGGLGTLSFPDQLTSSEADAALPSEPTQVVDEALVEGGAGAPGSAQDAVPAGSWTIRVATLEQAGAASKLKDRLVSEDQEVWQRFERVGGKPAYEISIGGFPSEHSARLALVALKANLSHVPEVALADVAEIP